MKNINLISACKLLILFALSYSFSTYSQTENINSFAFTHVNIIPMNKEIVLTDYTVIVYDGLIKEIGLTSFVNIPNGTHIIDVRGKYMIPGLSDMHIHLEGDAWNLLFPPESQFKLNDSVFSDLMFLYIANGVTTVEILSALPEHIILRDKIKKEEILGPRLVLSRMR